MLAFYLTNMVDGGAPADALIVSTYAPNWLSPSMRLGCLLLFGWIGKWLSS